MCTLNKGKKKGLNNEWFIDHLYLNQGSDDWT